MAEFSKISSASQNIYPINLSETHNQDDNHENLLLESQSQLLIAGSQIEESGKLLEQKVEGRI